MQPSAADTSGAPPIGSASFWKQPYRVPASSDPDTATAQTIAIMCGHVSAAASDEAVRQTAQDAARRFGGLGLDGGGLAVTSAEWYGRAAWHWCKLYIKFVHHEFIIRERLGESGHLQGLIAPEVLVRMAHPEGDCAIFSECIAAFLAVFGVPFEFVTVAANPNEPEIFSHVYLYAVLPDGSRLPLDASHGQYPGWQVPSAHVSRRQVWDSSGSPVSDRGSRFDGLHNYGLRGRGLGALVFDDQTGGYYDDGTGSPGGTGQEPATGPGSSPAMPGQFIDYTTGTVYSGPTYTVPSQSSAQWAPFAAAMVKGGFDLAKLNAIQPGTVLSANGAILRQNPGYAVGTPTGALNLGGGGISTNMMLVGGAVLLAVLLMGKK